MKRVVLIIAVVGCGKKAAKEDTRPKGKLCFAANTAEMFKWTKDGATVDYLDGLLVAIKYRGKGIPVPNDQKGFEDAREGEAVAVYADGLRSPKDDKLLESWKVNFKRLGNDLCYYFRGFDPAKPDRKPGWILDANTADDRCTCFPPAAPAGSGSGSQ